MFCAFMTSKKTWPPCARPKHSWKRPRNDASISPVLGRTLAKFCRDPPPERRDLLRLSLFPRNARGEGAYRARDCFSDPDFDFAIAEPGRHRLDHSQLLGLSCCRARGDFPTGVAPRPRGAGRSPDLFPHERET